MFSSRLQLLHVGDHVALDFFDYLLKGCFRDQIELDPAILSTASFVFSRIENIACFVKRCKFSDDGADIHMNPRRTTVKFKASSLHIAELDDSARGV